LSEKKKVDQKMTHEVIHKTILMKIYLSQRKLISKNI